MIKAFHKDMRGGRKVNETPSYYSILTAEIRYDKRLKANEKLLYSEITALTSKNGQCWASNRYFAELYDVQPKTVSEWISHLKELGYIETELIYHEGTKEVHKRVIKIAPTPIPKKTDTPPEKTEDPYPEKKGEGIPKKPEENNTSINNTRTNNKNMNNTTEEAAADLNLELVSEAAQPDETPAAAPTVSPFRLYQEVFGVLNPITQQDIQHWIDDLTAEVVCEAMRRATFEQKNYRYAQGIMRSWVSKNIKTLEQVKADDVAHENASKSRSKTKLTGISKHRRVEKFPEYIVKPPQDKSGTVDQQDVDELFNEYLPHPDEGGDWLE